MEGGGLSRSEFLCGLAKAIRAPDRKLVTIESAYSGIYIEQRRELGTCAGRRCDWVPVQTPPLAGFLLRYDKTGLCGDSG